MGPSLWLDYLSPCSIHICTDFHPGTCHIPTLWFGKFSSSLVTVVRTCVPPPLLIPWFHALAPCKTLGIPWQRCCQFHHDFLILRLSAQPHCPTPTSPISFCYFICCDGIALSVLSVLVRGYYTHRFSAAPSLTSAVGAGSIHLVESSLSCIPAGSSVGPSLKGACLGCSLLLHFTVVSSPLILLT